MKRKKKVVEIKFQLYEKQRLFVESNALYRGFTGGRGTGKSKIGAYDLIIKAKPKRSYMVVSPTATMVKETSLPPFIEIAERFGIIQKQWKSPYPRFLLTNGATVVFRSAEKPDRLRGGNYSGVWLDEASLMKEEIHGICIATLREAQDLGWLSATFTPRGKLHWTYTIFGDEEKRTHNTILIHAKTSENPFLHKDFAGLIRSQLTTLMAEQELDGFFVDQGDNSIKEGWLKYADFAPVDAKRVRFWDTASTVGGCFTAGVLVAKSADGKYWVEDVERFKYTTAKRNERIRQVAIEDRNRGYVKQFAEIQAGGGGIDSFVALQQHLSAEGINIEGIPTGNKSKSERAKPLESIAEHANLWILQRSWTKEFVLELINFPQIVNKDQVDAVSGAVNKLLPENFYVPYATVQTPLPFGRPELPKVF